MHAASPSLPRHKPRCWCVSALWEDSYDLHTLRRLANRGFAVAIECGHCHHVSHCEVTDLVSRYGAAISVKELRQRARCEFCKRRRAVVLLHQAGLRGNLGWWPHPPRANRDDWKGD
jgi:hypothetical protein